MIIKADDEGKKVIAQLFQLCDALIKANGMQSLKGTVDAIAQCDLSLKVKGAQILKAAMGPLNKVELMDLPPAEAIPDEPQADQ